MAKHITNENYIARCISKHGEAYTYLENYRGANIKLDIKCNTCQNIFKQRPADHWAGRGCDKCAHTKLGLSKKFDNEIFLDKCKQQHGDKYTYLSQYETSRKKIKIKCNECQHIFYQRAGQHYRGHGCPECKKRNTSKRRLSSHDEFLNKARKVHSTIFEYITKYKTSSSLMTIKCNGCQHIFKQSPNNHLQGHGCPNCKKLNSGLGQIMSNIDFLKKANQLHNFKFSYSSEYQRSKTKIDILCPDCDTIFKQSPNNHLQGQGCPNCAINGFNINKSARLYYLYDPQEDLYKIGITNKTLEDRFGKSFLKTRNIKILQETEYSKGLDALDAEQEILEAFSHGRTINPSWPENKGGKTEFFDRDILNLNKRINNE